MRRHELQSCQDWLRRLLSDGPVRSNVILKQAREQGFSEFQLCKARVAIGADRRKSVRKGAPLGSGVWLWELVPTQERLHRALDDLEKMRRTLDRLTVRIEAVLVEGE